MAPLEIFLSFSAASLDDFLVLAKEAVHSSWFCVQRVSGSNPTLVSRREYRPKHSVSEFHAEAP